MNKEAEVQRVSVNCHPRSKVLVIKEKTKLKVFVYKIQCFCLCTMFCSMGGKKHNVRAVS